MRTGPIVILAGFSCILIASTSLLAHHGYAAYDMTKTLSMTGTVTSYSMANPHGSIALDVKDADGKLVHWIVETGATVRLMRAQGFTPDTLKPGDTVTVTFSPGKDANKHIGVFIQVELADGEVFPKPTAGGNAAANPAGQ
jgi:hypothetical protein